MAPAASLRRPSDLVLEGAQSVLVADLDLDAIVRVNLETGSQTTVAGGDKLRGPYRIALGPEGRLFATQLESLPGLTNVLEISIATGAQRALSPSAAVRGLAVAPGSPAPPACRDGYDNDRDARVDFPADTGCTGADDGTEEPPCADGIDNDRDGLVDHPADPGCEDASPLAQEAPACDNGADDDGDGWFDHPEDPECLAPSDATEHWAPRGSASERRPVCGLIGIEAGLLLALARRGRRGGRSPLAGPHRAPARRAP
jgi:hypothetical protein